MSDDPFRTAALLLRHLPPDERERPFVRLFEDFWVREFGPDQRPVNVVAMTIRHREMWNVGAEIGVLEPLPKRH